MTPTYPSHNPYAYADRVVKALVKRFIRLYGNVNLLPADELNVLRGVRGLYDEVYQIVREAFLRLGRKAYADRSGASLLSARVKRRITENWLDKRLSDYDPVTKTVFANDFRRREELLAEAILATGDADRELRNALKTMTRMIRQEAITVTDRARDAADQDDDVGKVIWLTRQDELRCGACGMLHGEIFDADQVPDKPHVNCRCWTVRYPFKGD